MTSPIFLLSFLLSPILLNLFKGVFYLSFYLEFILLLLIRTKLLPNPCFHFHVNFIILNLDESLGINITYHIFSNLTINHLFKYSKNCNKTVLYIVLACISKAKIYLASIQSLNLFPSNNIYTFYI